MRLEIGVCDLEKFGFSGFLNEFSRFLLNTKICDEFFSILNEYVPNSVNNNNNNNNNNNVSIL